MGQFGAPTYEDWATTVEVLDNGDNWFLAGFFGLVVLLPVLCWLGEKHWAIPVILTTLALGGGWLTFRMYKHAEERVVAPGVKRKDLHFGLRAEVTKLYLRRLREALPHDVGPCRPPEELAPLSGAEVEASVSILTTPVWRSGEQHIGVVQITATHGDATHTVWEIPLIADDNQRVIVLMCREIAVMLRRLYSYNLAQLTRFAAEHPEATVVEASTFVVAISQERLNGAPHVLRIGMFDMAAAARLQVLRESIAADPDRHQDELQQLLDDGPRQDLPDGAISPAANGEAAADDRALSSAS